jgi:hypothetical protein
VTTPGVTPITTPDEEPTVAIVVLLLVQTPPVGELVSANVPPTHTLVAGVPVVPVITVGSGFTVMVVVTKQPPGNVYVMTVVPDETPVTTPLAEPIVAIDGEPEVHTPPPGELLRLIDDPTQTVEGPVITVGVGFTVMVMEVEQPVDNV